MPNLLARLRRACGRPEYLCRPAQLLVRLSRLGRPTPREVRLAWGLPVEIDPTAHPDVDMLNLGVYDLVVCEAICRLLDRGERALDGGAHVGQNASIMALTAGLEGRVSAFEPHPELFAALTANVERWRRYRIAPVEPLRLALGSGPGRAVLYEPEGFHGHPGSSSLLRPASPRAGLEVETTTLDALLPPPERAGLIKLDVEGWEVEVLRGAARLIGERRVRDLIYEDFAAQPSAATRLLEEAGYSVFRLETTRWRPGLRPRGEWAQRPPEPATCNYLATAAPERARDRFRPTGWRCLRIRARRRHGAA